MGSLVPNEVARIAQHVRTGKGRKGVKDGMEKQDFGHVSELNSVLITK